MFKILVMPNKKEDIKILLSTEVDAFLLGIKDLCVNNIELDINEIEEYISIIKQSDKEIFISLNKNIHNKDLPLLEDILIKLSKLNINGVFYYDLSILEIKTKLNLDINLVWAQNHLVTNYNTINYYNKLGVKYALLASEVTLKEIIDISNNTKTILIIPLFGYVPIFNSKRSLITNYLNYINLNKKNDLYYLYDKKEKLFYPICEDNKGTIVYSDYILNGIEEIPYLNNKDNYILMNGFNIEIKEFIEVIANYKKVITNKVIDVNVIDSILDKKTSKGFLYTETYYKVKNNE